MGIADAATGGGFTLGKVNHETSTATLTNSKGTPLALNAKKGKPPLAVNSKTLVPHLNANFVGGLSAGQLQRKLTGSCPIGIASVSPSGVARCVHGAVVHATPGPFTLVVPAGVHQITAYITGAGGSGGNSPGGWGGFEEVLITTTPGAVFDGVVGSGGALVADEFSAGNAGDSSTLTRHGGGVVASASGGAGGLAVCQNANQAAAGGEPGTPGADAVGISGISGSPGQCYGLDVGTVGFPGFGGQPTYNSTYPDGDGQIVIEFTG